MTEFKNCLDFGLHDQLWNGILAQIFSYLVFLVVMMVMQFNLSKMQLILIVLHKRKHLRLKHGLELVLLFILSQAQFHFEGMAFL